MVFNHDSFPHNVTGAKHLYLLDYNDENLPNLKETIEKSYADVRVTTVQADAADEKAISGLCEQALREEGRLDVFFANVCMHFPPRESPTQITARRVTRRDGFYMTSRRIYS